MADPPVSRGFHGRDRGAQSTDVGTRALMPYSADYFFFSPTAAACAGDCNGDGHTTVDELIAMVRATLFSEDAFVCPAGDANADNTIAVEEIVRAVAAALGTPCGGG